MLLVGSKPAQMARKKQANKRKASEVTNNLPDHLNDRGQCRRSQNNYQERNLGPYLPC